MRLHQLKYTTIIDANLDHVWRFFSNPRNLEELTPKNMKFKITADCNGSIYAGKIISYVITPIANVPMQWVTEISHFKENEYFVDEQRFGPYKFWHHVHRFIEEDGKTLMIDEVIYAYYGGVIGDFLQHLFISKQIEKIFDYRSVKIKELF